MTTNRIAPYLRQPRAPFFLIAEDNPDDRLLLSYAFSAVDALNGASVDFVEDGQELMDYLRREGRYAGDTRPLPDFLLLDLNLPKKDGIEALIEIRETPELADLPVVVLTSSTSAVDKILVENLAAVEFATKPDEFEQLIGFVQHLIGFFYKTAI